MNKLYSKPELNVEKFDVEDIITASSDKVNSETDTGLGELSVGMEFDVAANGNEF